MNLQSFLSGPISSDAFSTDPSERATYQPENNPLIDRGEIPAWVLRPPDPEALAQVIRRANDTGLVLVPVSSRPPHLRDGIVCKSPHGVVDLSGWTEISDIDRRNRVCRIAPGVTYGQLREALQRHGLTVPTPLAPRPGKSVLASVMDREPTIWPNKQWDISDPVGSTEFYFGTGERFRTGAAGAPGSLAKQRRAGGAQKCPTGPSQTDFQRMVQGAQGTMGIVTWITLRCEVRPTQEKPFLLAADRLQELIPFVYEVQRPWLGEHSFILDRSALGMLLQSESGANEARQAAGDLPRFICLQNIAGFEVLARQRVTYQRADIEEIAGRHGLHMTERLGKLEAGRLLTCARRPSVAEGWRNALQGACLSVAFQTTLDRAPGHLNLAQAIAEKGSPALPMGCYIQPQVQNHMCTVEFLFPYNPGDPIRVSEAATLEARLTGELLDAGAFFSRPYGKHQSRVFDRNPGSLHLLRQMKQIFDPNGILNPGKWSIQDHRSSVSQ